MDAVGRIGCCPSCLGVSPAKGQQMIIEPNNLQWIAALGLCCLGLFNSTRNQTTVNETIEDRRIINESGGVVAGEGGVVNISSSDPATVRAINEQTVGAVSSITRQAVQTIAGSAERQLALTATITGQALQQSQAITREALQVRREANQSQDENLTKTAITGVAIVAIAFGLISMRR